MIIRILFLLFAVISLNLSSKEISISIANKKISLQVADTNELRAKGLMGIRVLKEDEGMIFLWPDADQRCMWMKNTSIKLSIAFINSNKMIAEIKDLEPYSIESVCSRSNDIISAIEMNKDWFVKNNIRVFAKVNIP
tara:strand:- start:828 stop:1238 length:411 start_codon:yes stop_codon:yes gene_type:complete